MRPWHVRRWLFGLFLVQEGVIWIRSTPEQRMQAPPVKRPALFGALLLLPFFWRLRRPAWLERLALALQLMQNDSFGVHPTAATTGVQSGLYRLEHPIYLGLLMTQLGWTLTCPPSWPVLLAKIRAKAQIDQCDRLPIALVFNRSR